MTRRTWHPGQLVQAERQLKVATLAQVIAEMASGLKALEAAPQTL